MGRAGLMLLSAMTMMRYSFLIPVVLAFSQKGPPFQLKKLDHIVIRCKDFDPMFDFYTNVLGCTVDRPEDIGRFGGVLTHLRAGDAYIDLLAYNVVTPEGQEALQRMHSGGQGTASVLSDIQFSAASSTVDHFCLRVDDSFDETSIRNFMEAQGIHIIGSGERKGADGMGPALYVQDPEGNVIELKGPPTHQASLENSDEDSTITTQNDNHDVPVHDDAPQVHSIKDTTPNDMETIPVTPCIRLCRYNADFFDGQVCIGCFREGYEIGTWNSMTPTERSFALLDAADRYSDIFEGSVSKEELLRQAQAWNDKK